MRDSLKKSVQDSPVRGFEKYLKGSVVLCNACAAPIYKLDESICLGDKAGRMARAFKPLSVDDLRVLGARDDIDAGLRAWVRSKDVGQLQAHCALLHEIQPGDPSLCPVCGNGFTQVLAIEKNEVLEKVYTIELVTVPPFGAGRPVAVRGRQIGAHKGQEWVH